MTNEDIATMKRAAAALRNTPPAFELFLALLMQQANVTRIVINTKIDDGRRVIFDRDEMAQTTTVRLVGDKRP